jgi:hypothetical protein
MSEDYRFRESPSRPQIRLQQPNVKLQQARILLTNELATRQEPILPVKTRLLTTSFVDHALLSK